MLEEKLILITNDDGVDAPGLKALIEAMQGLGKLVVVAPTEPQSGMSQAITVKHPLRIRKIKKEEALEIYSVNGTPTDCVKLALNQLLDRRPDLLVSGINHGSNSAVSIFYSGTMGAAIEGSINAIPSIGFSTVSYDTKANLETAKVYSRSVAQKVFENGIPKNICLNVNFPDVPVEQVSGVKICRQNKGHWQEEFEKRTDPHGRIYYWLTGEYHNAEPEANDTDEWALKNNYVSIVPAQLDLTCYDTLHKIKKWKL